MLLNWVRLWEQLNKGKDRCRLNGLRHSMADPLEGAEWGGLLWAVPFLSWLTSPGHERRREEKAPRPRDYLPVNDSSRSSAGSRDAETRRRSAC
ncbi:Hypothetical protein NGAL_HAMBI1189_47110 [Neorhizobium galegae bv. officinalis]|uniref:Uncharacterized protein n=1 Tax=Neorhizobium galegae bv. officinalis TaxID=323656 RepID=A0A0T7H058_NEOGA|nr:Hypothetical protein NGAL_HAMBI1189_47110 [Neorhizobium galegae bv. officinalis]